MTSRFSAALIEIRAPAWLMQKSSRGASRAVSRRALQSDGVAFYGIRGAVMVEAELGRGGELARGRARRRGCTQRLVRSACRIRHPIGGRQAACVHYGVGVIILLRQT
jgi:hypothetical protein